MILGTRGSALALAQTQMVLAALRNAHPGHTFSHEVIHTTGDLRQDLRLGRPDSGADKGVWTKELEAALAAGSVQAAVHSAKDVPTELPPGFHLAGCLPRAHVEDALICKLPGGIAGLAAGATVATSSVRRACQLRHFRPDLQVVEIRGNVPTRLQKLADSDALDALVLARAGLDRLGYATSWLEPADAGLLSPAVFSEVTLQPLPCGLQATLLPPAQFLPAAAQGIVTLEVFGHDPVRDGILSSITDQSSWRALRAEREFLRLLKAGCHTPIGLLTTEVDGHMTMTAIVFPEQALAITSPLTAQTTGSAHSPETVAAALFHALA
jgi:hydroxymethylbilane synthase